MAHEKHTSWSEGLKLIAYCPLCEMGYKPTQARLLRQKGETTFLHVTCRKCQTSILALVLIHGSGASSIGMVTDLSYEDALKFQESSPLLLETLLNLHQELERGTLVKALCERFAQPAPPGKRRLKPVEKRTRHGKTKTRSKERSSRSK